MQCMSKGESIVRGLYSSFVLCWVYHSWSLGEWISLCLLTCFILMFLRKKLSMALMLLNLWKWSKDFQTRWPWVSISKLSVVSLKSFLHTLNTGNPTRCNSMNGSLSMSWLKLAMSPLLIQACIWCMSCSCKMWIYSNPLVSFTNLLYPRLLGMMTGNHSWI